jgi:hypothetical protein
MFHVPIQIIPSGILIGILPSFGVVDLLIC